MGLDGLNGSQTRIPNPKQIPSLSYFPWVLFDFIIFAGGYTELAKQSQSGLKCAQN